MRILPGQKTFTPIKVTRTDRTAVSRINRGLPLEQHITAETYARKKLEGFKWCSLGKHWELRAEFNSSAREADGLGTNCRKHQSLYWQGYKKRQAQKAKAPAT